MTALAAQGGDLTAERRAACRRAALLTAIAETAAMRQLAGKGDINDAITPSLARGIEPRPCDAAMGESGPGPPALLGGRRKRAGSVIVSQRAPAHVHHPVAHAEHRPVAGASNVEIARAHQIVEQLDPEPVRHH